MVEEKKRTHTPSKPRHGKSMAVCFKCGSEFKLKRNTKHSKSKTIKGLCPSCGKMKIVIE